MKWLKRLLLAVVFLLVFAGVLGLAGYRMLHRAPAWYARVPLTPQARAAAAERAERQLQSMLSRAQEANNNQRRAASAEPSAPSSQPAGSLQLSLSEDELNAFFEKWDSSFGWSKRYERYLTDPQIILHEGHIILAATVKDMDTVVSVDFEPQLENEKLRLRVVQVLGGRLPLPQSFWGGYKQKLLASVQAKLPEWQNQAALSPDGLANTAALTAAMAELLLHTLNDDPAEPVIFIPAGDRHGHYLPVRLREVNVANKTLTLTAEPLPISERQPLMDRIKSPLPIAAAGGAATE